MAQIAHQMESALWVLCPEAFLSLLQAGILGEVSGGFSRCALSGSWSPLIGQHQGRVVVVTAAGPGVAHLPGFAAFLGLELKCN